MYIRIFVSTLEDGEDVSGIVRALRAIRLHQRGGAKASPWNIELCDGMTWCSSGQRLMPADVHIHFRVPVRVAMPWACANVVVIEPAKWKPLTWDWVFFAGGADLVVFESVPPATDFLPPECVVRQWTLPESEHRAFWERVLARPRREVAPLPKSLSVERGVTPPKVALITVTRNRSRWWPNMIQNVTKQTWPVSRLEWVIVDDGDAEERLEERVREFQERTPALVIRYVPLMVRTHIGEKRNIGCSAASADCDLMMMMDDDDHYPADSVAVRAAWLTCPDTKIVSCATIPVYDITRYISAMNIPPLDQAPAERVSEATLAFTRAVWSDGPFPPVSMAEGEEFIAGREGVFVEIPPAGVIVSFIHGTNSSSRRIPKDQPANGSHYGFSDEFFRYLHGVACLAAN